MRVRKTHEQFVKDIRKRNNKFSPVYLVEGQKYIHAKHKLTFKCEEGHKWQAVPSNILSGCSCPICFGRCNTTGFLQKLEQRNKTPPPIFLKPNQLYVNNRTKLEFACKNQHDFFAAPYAILSGNGCAICNGKKKKTTISFESELRNTNPQVHLRKGQRYKNIHSKLIFNCIKNHQWKATPKDVLIKRSSCPICAKQQYSSMAIVWLEALMENEHITIEHALNGGEFKIPTTNYRADGYCKETNTVYEFYGDAFHGNPKIFGRSDRCHPYNRKVTAQTLLARTRRRAERIRSLGLNLVEMWESDWTL